MVFALALALMASALLVRSVTQLRQARADLARTQAEFALQGAHVQAAAAVIGSGLGGPYRWSFDTSIGRVEAIAEFEEDKLELGQAAHLSDEVLRRFGVADPLGLRARLLRANTQRRVLDLRTLDSSALWKACAPVLISQFGRRTVLSEAIYITPFSSPKPAWRVSEAWRIEISAANGWRDERIVRFTGEQQQPVAVIERRFSRGRAVEGACADILNGEG